MPSVNFGAILGLGAPELLVILAILLLLLGGSRLPQLSRSLGSSMRELRKGMEEGDDDKKDSTTKNSDRQA